MTVGGPSCARVEMGVSTSARLSTMRGVVKRFVVLSPWVLRRGLKKDFFDLWVEHYVTLEDDMVVLRQLALSNGSTRVAA